MKTSLRLMSVLGAVGLAGLLGCAQQQLGGGPHDDGAPGDDAGCGPLGKMVCVSPTPGCTTPIPIAPVCLNGSWTCPPEVGDTKSCEPPVCASSLPRGCTCNVATGVTTCVDAGAVCPADAPDGSVLYCIANCSDNTAVVSTCSGGVWSCPPGTVDIRECPRDAGAAAGTSCPPLRGADGGIPACGCGSDSTPPPSCLAGRWTCSSGASPMLCPRYCSLSPPPPPGCMCNPTNGMLICRHDGGADAAPDGHGG